MYYNNNFILRKLIANELAAIFQISYKIIADFFTA